MSDDEIRALAEGARLSGYLAEGECLDLTDEALARGAAIARLNEEIEYGKTDRQAAEDMQALANRYMDERDTLRERTAQLETALRALLVRCEFDQEQNNAPELEEVYKARIALGIK